MNDSLLNPLTESEVKMWFPSKKILTPEEKKEMQEQLDESNANIVSLPHIIEYHIMMDQKKLKLTQT